MSLGRVCFIFILLELLGFVSHFTKNIGEVFGRCFFMCIFCFPSSAFLGHQSHMCWLCDTFTGP